MTTYTHLCSCIYILGSCLVTYHIHIFVLPKFHSLHIYLSPVCIAVHFHFFQLFGSSHLATENIPWKCIIFPLLLLTSRLLKTFQVTSRKDQQQYWARTHQPYCYIPVQEFACAFQSFHVGQTLSDELSHPFDKSTSHPASLTTSTYGASKLELLRTCIARELLLMKRNMFVYRFRAFQVNISSSSCRLSLRIWADCQILCFGDEACHIMHGYLISPLSFLLSLQSVSATLE